MLWTYISFPTVTLLPAKVVLNWGQFYPFTPGDIWYFSGCHNWGWGGAACSEWGEFRDTAKHPTKHRTDPHSNYPAQNVSSAEADKSCSAKNLKDCTHLFKYPYQWLENFGSFHKQSTVISNPPSFLT